MSTITKPASLPPDHLHVRDILPGSTDIAGRAILEVFAKREDFAIYLGRTLNAHSPDRVAVQFSDQPAIMARQLTRIDDLLPLRDRLEFLCEGLHREHYYQRRLATALQLALDGKAGEASDLINFEIHDAADERVYVGRRVYLQAASVIAAIAAGILITVGGSLRGGAAPAGHLLLSAGGGAIGALLSIAIALRDRTVAPDHNFAANGFDAGLRLLTGIIGGFAFNLFLSSGLLTNIVPTGAGTPSPVAGAVLTVSWSAALALGFAAGFIERLVPDLLARFGSAQSVSPQPKTEPPSASTGQVPEKSPPQQPPSARTGVSPHEHVLTQAAALPTPSYPNLVWYGGAVIRAPEVYASFWGPTWETDAALIARADTLSSFLTDLVKSDFMNVLHQYGVGTGTFSGRSYRPGIQTHLLGDDVRRHLQDLIDSGTVPEPSGGQTCVMIFLEDGITVQDGTSQLCIPGSQDAFGYHGFMRTRGGHSLYFAIVPGLTTACLEAACPGGNGECTLSTAQTQEERMTIVASHEFAEMTTNPGRDGWSDFAHGEIGDITNGHHATLVTQGRQWSIQKIFSKADDTGRPGAISALAAAAEPIPYLKGGPIPHNDNRLI